jgi:hypothetical protein
MSRGGPVVRRLAADPPEGIANPGKILMCHPSKGYRWIEEGDRSVKEGWGYQYVRDYHPSDEFNKSARLEDMTPAELREHAHKMEEYANVKEKSAQKESEAEQRYNALLARKRRKDAEDAARLSEMGLAQPSGPPSGAVGPPIGDEGVEESSPIPKPKRRGRPKGSKNK